MFQNLKSARHKLKTLEIHSKQKKKKITTSIEHLTMLDLQLKAIKQKGLN